ncbi:Hsp20/alpha crystallin family [Musa troglodytarum]|uniref:Hsp20/alpha crystallin family n=2 Tax=Musa troglodytarum TaxID=320322 RepID=A0A9E7JU74_9LILI|nr:Hsp20/alpha crystallin family [Musa troglodytarum]
MENADQTVRRRISRIHDQVAASAASDEALPPSPHLFAMNCSSSLSTLMQRRDNRLLFARQAPASRGRFMQQVERSQDAGSGGSQRGALPNCFCSGGSASFQNSGEPLFSRKTMFDSSAPSSRTETPMRQDAVFSSSEAPLFARENSGRIEKQQLRCRGRRSSRGIEWSPRMDVTESGPKYVVTVELPGVRAADVQVEVDDDSLRIMGKRLVSQWRVAGGWKPTYHQREILEGPYRVAWPLPKDVNRDGASAELMDGFLRVTLPKL